MHSPQCAFTFLDMLCACVSSQSSDDEEGLGKGRGRHMFVNKTEMPGWSETLESFRTARESWDLLHSHDGLETGKHLLCPYAFPSCSSSLCLHDFAFEHPRRVQENLRLLEDRQLALVQDIRH